MTQRDAPRYSAADLAAIIDVPVPTAEQTAIIESPLEATVVIAGAGSGKTTVIAHRVLWLVANGIVEPETILGLTFTRKAVGELNERIRSFLRTFWTRTRARSAPNSLPGLDVPVVSTYNAYAAGLVDEYGLAIGLEPDTTILDEASAHALAASVVDAAHSSEVPPGVARSTLIKNVREMAGQINEHLRTPDEVVEHLESSIDAILGPDYCADLLAGLKRKRIPGETKEELAARIPALHAASGLAAGRSGGSARRTPAQEEARSELLDLLVVHALEGTEVRAVTRLLAKLRIVRLARTYLALKRSEHAMEFSDQVADAHRIVTRDRTSAELERGKWSVVLLDEYQDTSDSQFTLLKELFGGMPVMAVGDPRQSIYAWRGASARNIGEYPLHFRTPDGSPAHRATLTTSWRNDPAILAVANRIASHLPDHDPTTELGPRPIEHEDGEVTFDVTLGESDEESGTEQYAHLVAWLRGLPPEVASRAVLCRKRSFFGPIAQALENAGFDVAVAGRTGALDDPYVADVHAALRVIDDPGAGDHLMRLVAGPVCTLGAADVAALDAFTRLRQRRYDLALAAADPTTGGADGGPRSTAGTAPGGTSAGDTASDAAEGADLPAADSPVAAPTGTGTDIALSIVEGLDDLADLAEVWDFVRGTPARAAREKPDALVRDWQESGLSGSGTTRLIRLGRSLRRLRGTRPSVVAHVRDVVRELRVDTEIGALGPGARGLHLDALDAFVSVTSGYAADHPHAGLRDFLDWLTIMEELDSLPGAEEVTDPDAVVLMTVHASKGLEFDAVAIPHNVEGDLPTSLRETSGWLTGGALPYPLRGDHAKLPPFDLRAPKFSTRKEAKEFMKEELVPALEEHHEVEERRLMYVAVTRARHRLWLGASWFTTRKTPNALSAFLREAMETLDHEIPEPPADLVAPEASGIDEVAWPVRHDAAVLARRAAKVRAVENAEVLPLEDLVERASTPIVAALAARGLALSTDRPVRPLALPERMSTTKLVSFTQDPQEFAEALVRPMPAAPNPAAGLGTRFHAWVENFYGQATLDDFDETGVEAPMPAHLQKRFEDLVSTFSRSAYASASPVDVERPFELVLDRTEGRAVTVPGKIDAIFAEGDTVRVVDWKTGSKPAAGRLEVMTIQLSVYALAVSRMPEFSGRPVVCEFYFVGSDEVVRAERLLGAAELVSALDRFEAEEI